MATAQRLDIEADVALANERLDGLGWTDGLPVIPPTEELVHAMLARSRHDPGDVLGRMQPLDGVVTVERVAANAVMAGCMPDYFPVVLAAVKAVLQPQFHVGSTACTTGGAAPVVIVNGPIATRLKINAGTACFGGNVRANATIGRALRLVMRNLGGAKPGGQEKSTQAWPGKVTCCFAENEDSPRHAHLLGALRQLLRHHTPAARALPTVATDGHSEVTPRSASGAGA